MCDCECPTPCVCGRVVDLHQMRPICGTLPDGGNLVCAYCHCIDCDGEGCDICNYDGYVPDVDPASEPL